MFIHAREQSSGFHDVRERVRNKRCLAMFPAVMRAILWACMWHSRCPARLHPPSTSACKTPGQNDNHQICYAMLRSNPVAKMQQALPSCLSQNRKSQSMVSKHPPMLLMFKAPSCAFGMWPPSRYSSIRIVWCIASVNDSLLLLSSLHSFAQLPQTQASLLMLLSSSPSLFLRRIS